MQATGTREAFLERYHTLKPGDAGLDAASRRVIFKSFARTLRPWLPPSRDAAILDVGCGEGALLSFLQERGYRNLEGFDLSPENIAICHGRGLGFVRGHDALRLETFDGARAYNAIFCLDLIEHIPKEQAVPFLRQVRARLAPGGYAVLQTPNMGSVHALYYRYDDLSHEYGLTENAALSLMTTAGFEEEKVQVRACWNATTWLGYLREVYLRGLHLAVWLAEGSYRPRIATKNLLIRAFR